MADTSIEYVVAKMINQMRYNRQIYSLNDLLSIIYTQDFSGSKNISISGLDVFLSEFGIFLTKIEQSTLIKYIRRDENTISVSKFSELFQIEPPYLLVKKCKEVFNKLNKNGVIEINDVWKYVNCKKLPLVTIFGRKVEYAKNKFESGINFAAVGGLTINEKEFIDLHRDMYALLPYDKAKFFLSSIPEIWGLN